MCVVYDCKATRLLGSLKNLKLIKKKKSKIPYEYIPRCIPLIESKPPVSPHIVPRRRSTASFGGRTTESSPCRAPNTVIGVTGGRRGPFVGGVPSNSRASGPAAWRPAGEARKHHAV